MIQTLSKLKLWHIGLLASLFLLPALFTDFYGDDFFHYAIFNHDNDIVQSEDPSLFNLFSFVDDNEIRRQQLKNLSIIPWWASEEFRWSFWRPATELTHAFDYTVLSEHQPLMHVHSLLWYLLLIACVLLFATSMKQQAGFAALFTLLFALDGSHGMMVGWLCSRSPILACIFGILCLLAHHKAQADNRFFLLSFLCMVLSLLSAEIGISTTAYLFAYNVFLNRASLTQRFVQLVPYGLIVIVWWVLYKQGGFGVAGSNDFYLEPLQEPMLFLKRLGLNIPLTVFSQWVPIPVDLLAKPSPLQNVAWLAGLGLLLLTPKIGRFTRQPALVYFLTLGAVLSVCPLASTPLQERNIVFISLGFIGIIALLIYQLATLSNEQKGPAKTLCFYSLFILHLVLSPLLLSAMSYMPTWLSRAAFDRAATIDYQAQDQLVILGGPIMEVAYLSPSLLWHQDYSPQSIWQLAGAQGTYTIKRIDKNTLELSSPEGLIGPNEEFVRDLQTSPFKPGEKIDLGNLRIEVIAITEEGNARKLHYQFKEPLDNYQFLQWHQSGYKTLTMNKTFAFEWAPNQ